MPEHTFTRLHIPTGKITTGRFNASHHHVLVYPDGYGYHTVQNAKLAVINRWNAQQPKEWKYWL